MPVTPAALRPSDDGKAFCPYATDIPPLEDAGYVEEEWIAEGAVDGERYATTVLVRRPADPDRFSGTLIVEPVHVHGIAPIWIYTAPYLLRAGHAWVVIAAQKTTLDMHVKPSNPERYAELHIEGPDTSDFDSDPQLGDPDVEGRFWQELRSRNAGTSEILAQVGAALRRTDGPVPGARHVVLAGHSQTGSVASYYIEDAHDALRLDGGAPVYDGYFPSGFPYAPFHDVDVPIIQVMSDGDVSLPDFSFRPGYEGRPYRRDDSDAPGDRYRLYELAGAPHMGTRHAPFDDVSLWEANLGAAATADGVALGPRMNSLPTFELFAVCLDHLLRWVAEGTVPPRAERLEIDHEGYVAKDEHGNSRGGVRCVQLDVPHSTHNPNPLRADGTPSYLTVGTDVPFDAERLRNLYGDPAAYREQFETRLQALLDQGWLLVADADDMRREAEGIRF